MPKKPLSLSFIFVLLGFILAIVFYIYSLTWLLKVVLLFICALIINHIIRRSRWTINFQKWIKSIASIVIFIIWAVLSWFPYNIKGHPMRQWEQNRLWSQQVQNVKPKVTVSCYPSWNPFYKYPHREYLIMIQDTNLKSATILNFTMEFIFENILVKAKPIPLNPTGEDITIHPSVVYGKGQNDSGYYWEEQSKETSITKNFSLYIKQDNINGQLINTNVLVFHCNEWPREWAFSAEVVADLSKKPKFIQREPTGIYQGLFSYEVEGQTFSEKINGSITKSDDEKIKK